MVSRVLKSSSAYMKLVLKAADDFILAHSQLRARSTAETFQIENLRSWFYNNPRAIDEEEQEFVNQGGDVIPLVEKRKPFLHLLFEHIDDKYLAKWFSVKDRPDRVKSETTTYSSNKKIDVVMTAVIVVIGLLVLLGPMWWLEFVVDGNRRLGIISAFVVLFAGILASATVQRPFEVLAGTAA